MRSFLSMINLSKSLALLATTAALSACVVEVEPTPTPTPTPEQAPFAELTADGKVSIDTSALGRPVLMMITYSTSTSAEDTNPLRSRIVHFEQDEAAGEVVMKEMQSGSSSPSPADRVIATFPATKNGTALEFDFNAGASEVYVEFAVYEWWKAPKEIVFPVKDGKIQAIELDEGTLVIDRTANAEVPKVGPVPVTLKYGFREYTSNEAFAPRPNNEVNGFYVNVPIPGESGGEDVSYAHRHDLKKPITYFIASDTPPERKKEIEISVGYWNRIFTDLGLDKPLVLDELPAGIQPMDPRRNVIAWLPNPLDGAGRALNTTDPLTGQILKSTVFVSSVFQYEGEDAAESVWMKTALNQGMAPSPLSPEIKARAVSDYYINAYTHEIGHGLGLRHNFAGSLEATNDSKPTVKPFADYLGADVADGFTPSSSVMEYSETPMAILVGAHIRLGRDPLPYDVEAIRSMYTENKPMFGLYCETESTSVYVDCAEFDRGSDSAVGTYWQWEAALDDLSFRLAKAVMLGVKLTSPDLDPKVDALIIDAPLARLSAHLAKDAQYLALRSKYPADWSASDQTAYVAEVLAHQKQSYAGLDGGRVVFVQELVTGGLSAARVQDLATTVRTKMEAYLTLVGASVDAAEADAYFAALVAAMTAELEPLNQVPYADLAP